MYNEMTNSDLIVVAYEKAHPSDNPSSENADLIDELCNRLRKMEGYRMRMHDLSKQVDRLIRHVEQSMANNTNTMTNTTESTDEAGNGGQDCWLAPDRDPSGEWVRWEDIETLVENG